MTQRESREAITWELALAIRFAHPALMSVGVAAIALASFVVVRWLSDVPLLTDETNVAIPLEPSAVTGIVISLLLGYIIFGNGYSYLERRKELARIGITDEEPTPSDFRDLRMSRIYGALAAAFGVVMVMTVPGSYGLRFDRADADYFWFLAVSPVLLSMLARGIFFSLRRDATLERVRARKIDLLRLDSVQMFGRLGVQSAFVWVVGTSIGMLLFFGRGLTLPVLPVMGVTLCVAVAALVMPVRGLSERIREAKRAELAKVTAGLEKARDAALAGTQTERGQLADLLAYRSYIETIRESPIDPSTLLRFGAYLLIPLGSWSASAVVERIVDSILD